MPTSALTIRAFQAGDEAAIADLIVPIQRQEFDIPITLADQPDLADITGFYGHGAGGFWVADHEGKIVGTIALLDIGDNQAALRKMFVAQDYRGSDMGVANRLLKHLINEARQRGVLEIYLGTTAAFTAAHRFYEKNGFVHYSKTDLPARFPIMAVDSRFYQMTI